MDSENEYKGRAQARELAIWVREEKLTEYNGMGQGYEEQNKQWNIIQQQGE